MDQRNSPSARYSASVRRARLRRFAGVWVLVCELTRSSGGAASEATPGSWDHGLRRINNPSGDDELAVSARAASRRRDQTGGILAAGFLISPPDFVTEAPARHTRRALAPLDVGWRSGVSRTDVDGTSILVALEPVDLPASTRAARPSTVADQSIVARCDDLAQVHSAALRIS
jgi:hypothetical protein